MTNIQKDSIASVLLLQKFSPGENIVNEGDIAASFYIIKQVHKKFFNNFISL